MSNGDEQVVEAASPAVELPEMSFVDWRDAGARLGERPSVVKRLLLADGVPVVELGVRKWKVRVDHFEDWLEVVRPARARERAEQAALRATYVRPVEQRSPDLSRWR